MKAEKIKKKMDEISEMVKELEIEMKDRIKLFERQSHAVIFINDNIEPGDTCMTDTALSRFMTGNQQYNWSDERIVRVALALGL